MKKISPSLVPAYFFIAGLFLYAELFRSLPALFIDLALACYFAYVSLRFYRSRMGCYILALVVSVFLTQQIYLRHEYHLQVAHMRQLAEQFRLAHLARQGGH